MEKSRGSDHSSDSRDSLVWIAWVLLFAALPLLTSGCGVGIVALALWVDDGSDASSAEAVVLPPVVESLRVTTAGTPEKVFVDFSVRGSQGKVLSALVRFVPFTRNMDGQFVEAPPARDATPLGGALRSDLPPGQMVRFVWDAGTDMNGKPPWAQVVVTPCEGKVEGEPKASAIVHGGQNSPAQLAGMKARQDRLVTELTFRLVDSEWDSVTLDAVELAIAGEDGVPSAFVRVPDCAVTLGLGDSLPSAPGPEGIPGRVLVDLGRLGDSTCEVPAELKALLVPGFYGSVALKIVARDFPLSGAGEGEARFTFDNNEMPFVELLPVEPEQLSSGVIALRYRIFDSDRNLVDDPSTNLADLRVEVDIGDGLGYRTANEFPRAPSDGREDLRTLPAAAFGDSLERVGVFLWDALSQVPAETAVSLSLSAWDQEAAERAAAGQVLPKARTVLRGFSLAPVASSANLSVGGSSSLLASGDFNGDRFADVAAVNYVDVLQGYGVTCLAGGPSGLQSAVDPLPIEGDATAVLSDDFDGDRFLDVVVVCQWPPLATCLRGGPAGLAPAEDGIALEGGPDAMASGDFNGDDFPDVVVMVDTDSSDSDGLAYLRGSPGGLASGGVLIPVVSNLLTLVPGDFDGDGFVDLVVGIEAADTVALLRGGAAGLTPPGDLIPVGELPVALAAEDFDGDGFLDVLVANEGSGSVTYLRGSPSGLSVSGDPVAVGEAPVALAAGDFNRDGFSDALVANRASGSVSYLRGGLGGIASAGSPVLVGEAPVALVAGDFDGDGFLDALVANQASDNVGYVRGSLAGIALAGEPISVKESPTALVAGDFDGDGFLDALVANRDSGTLTYLRGSPSGPAASGEPVRAGKEPGALVAGQFDDDGLLDAVVANHRSGDLVGLRGGPTGPYRARVFSAAGRGPDSLAVGDFDGDGLPDVIAGTEGSSSVTYLRQRFLLSHVNELIEPQAGAVEPRVLTEPRNPPRFQLQLPDAALPGPTQVCLLPGPVFEFPQAEAFRRGKYYLAVTDPASILRETVELAGPPGAQLTLRLRDHDPDVLAEVLTNAERLRVLRKDPATGIGAMVGLAPGEIQIVDFAHGKGASFPIARFGSYAVAIEKDR